MRSKNIHAEMFQEYIKGENLRRETFNEKPRGEGIPKVSGDWNTRHKEPNSQGVYKTRG